MTFLPFIHRNLEKNHLILSKVISLIGYYWLGFIFIFFVSGLIFDLIHLVYPLNSKIKFIFPLILTLAISFYGHFENKQIKTETIRLKSPLLAKEKTKITMVQISDLHLNANFSKKNLKNIIKIIKEVQPDILVSSGDFIDGTLTNSQEIALTFSEITPPLGKYAVTGNHEYYSGLDKSKKFIEAAGFQLLQSTWVNIGSNLTITGIDDKTGSYYHHNKKSIATQEIENLKKLPPNRFTILLKHRPVVLPETIKRINLQLSGHTHKGQIFPFNLFTKLIFKYNAGLFKLDEDSFIYVNRGTGSWGPPIRFLARPEITIIELSSE